VPGTTGTQPFQGGLVSDELSFAEVDGQHVELLPARTVLSVFSTGATSGPHGGDTGAGGAGGTGGPAGAGSGQAYFWYPVFYTEGDVTNNLTSGVGGASSADGGATTGGAASVLSH
jgi:hypothetical protein